MTNIAVCRKKYSSLSSTPKLAPVTFPCPPGAFVFMRNYLLVKRSRLFSKKYCILAKALILAKSLHTCKSSVYLRKHYIFAKALHTCESTIFLQKHCILAKSTAYLQKALFTCKKLCLLAKSSLYLQKALFTCKKLCLLAKKLCILAKKLCILAKITVYLYLQKHLYLQKNPPFLSGSQICLSRKGGYSTPLYSYLTYRCTVTGYYQKPSVFK